MLQLNETGVLVSHSKKGKTGAEANLIEIVDARARGDAENALELISAGYDVHNKDVDGWTPLHHAAYVGLHSIVKILLEEGADVNALDKDGAQALHHAAFNGSLESVKLLFKKKANVNVKDIDGGTPVHNSCYNGHLECLKFLAEKGADLNAKDGDNSTPLHYACFKGNLECVAFLLDKGVDVSPVDKEGSTPLHHAASHGFDKICSFLIKAGAKTSSRDHLGGTPLMSATYNRKVECVKILLESKETNVNGKDNEGSNCLHKASFVGDITIIKLLITSGANINEQDEEGATPLHKASFNGSIDAVELLINSGADVNIKDKDGGTSLLNAIYNGHAGVAALLLSKKAEVNIVDNEGRTPLHIACCFGLKECISVLLDKHAKIGVQDDNGATPLHMAAFNGQHYALALLLDKGADANVKTNTGSTPLHFSAYKGHLPTSIYLVTRGADVNQQDSKGNTPLHSSAVYDNSDVLTYLLYKRSKLEQQNKLGMTALHYAVRNGCGRNAYLLMEKGSSADIADKKGLTPKELSKQSLSEDIKVIFKFIEEEKNPFSMEAKSRLFLTLDERSQNQPEFNAQIDTYNSVMDPYLEKKMVSLNKKSKALSEHGIYFDVNDAVEMCQNIEKEAKKMNRHNTLLNILRHFLLIPSNSTVANKVWNLLEVFVHGCVMLRDEQDESLDEIKLKFGDWKKMYMSRNRIDIDQKLNTLSTIAEALSILFPNLNFEHEGIEEDDEDATFEPTEEDFEEEETSALGKKGKERNFSRAQDEDEDEDDDLDALDDDDEEEQRGHKKSGFVDSGTGAFDLSAIRFEDEEEEEGSSSGTGGPPIPPPPPSDSSDGVPPPPPPPLGLDSGPGGPPPPPPPMGMDMGGPVPPPPLPGMSGIIDKHKIKLKKINWDKIPSHKIKETFWKTVKPASIKLDRKILEKHFYVKERIAEKAETQKSKVITLVDLKRANNVGILLSRMKVPVTSIRTAIEVLDEKLLSLENTRALLKLSPSADEVDTLKNFKGDKQRLGVTEKFFMEIMEIPRLQTRLESWVYKREFVNKMTEINEDMKGINDACRRIGNSKRLKQLLQIVLAVGNSLNSGAFTGSAQGFKISSVLKVKDTKSESGKYTLLHYVVSLCEEKKPDLLDWHEEVPDLKPGTKDRIATIEAELSLQKKGLALMEEEVKEAKSNDPLKKIMNDFLPVAKNEVARLDMEVNRMRKGFEDLATFYGEDSGTDVPAVIIEFITHFNTAVADNRSAKEVAQRQAQKKMQQGKKKRKGLVEKTEKTASKPMTSLLGENHLEMRKRVQKSRQSKTKRNTKQTDIPGADTL